MHEVSIALNVLEIVEKKCRESGCRTIESVRLRVGRASSVAPEALTFALDVVKENTLAKNAKFFIEEIPLGGSCRQCGRRFETEERYILECPLCGSRSFQIEKGYELEVVEMEVN
jgi:hydrogenase nickel incorporation protein HypA/HybF